MRYCAFSISNWQPALTYNKSGRLSAGSIVQLVITILVMVLLIIFMKKGHVPVSSLVYMGILFALVLAWLLGTKNCNPFENPVSRKIFKIYFFLITVCLALLYAIDFEHFDYLHQRLNASVLNYTQDAKISMNMVWQTYPVFKLLVLVIIGAAIVYGLIAWSYKKIQPAVYRGRHFGAVLIGSCIYIIVGAGYFWPVKSISFALERCIFF